MKSILELPLGLLVLTSATVAATFTGASVGPGAHISLRSPVDPFKHLRLRATPKPSEPVCCLIPSPSDAVPGAAEFLSFEEWKSKQLELQAKSVAPNHTSFPNTSTSNAPPYSPSATTAASRSDAEVQIPPSTETMPVLSPFPVPLIDRFNYASLDCSARVHASHRAARFPSAILSSKKDRYMLSPCSADPNFVVVELCDDIRIDTIQLANFEFFSGVFRDFRVSVAQTYTNDGHEWVEAGTYIAKNIRGVQSFHPQVELRPFYRFVRIDFLSHYGNEFYCPISLLRVYGLTQLEEWKWEVWRGGAEGINTKGTPDNIQEHKPQTALSNSPPANQDVINSTVPSPSMTESITASEGTKLSSTPETYIVSVTQEEKPLAPVVTSKTLQITTQTAIQTVPMTHIPSNTLPTDQHGIPLAGKNISSSATTHLMNGTASVSDTDFSNISASSISTLPAMTPVPSSPPVASGESVFKTIMNRLTMLEANTTLYHKYVEEQTVHMRDALRRLEEDVGRLDGISKAQKQLFSKVMHELEHRRHRMEEERWELLNKVSHLTEEVNLEKRLGIAQLCLLLTVLIFMALTRGSRTDAASLLNGTMQELHTFRQRSPWSSVDWTMKNGEGRSPTPTPARFSQESVSPLPKTPRLPTSRTPLRRSAMPRHQDFLPSSAGRPDNRLYRSNSHSLPVHMPTSAKRFARSAHLHPVKQSARHRSEADGSDSDAYNQENDSTVDSQHFREEEKRIDGERNDLTSRPTASEGSEPESWIDTELGSEPGEFELGFDIPGQVIQPGSVLDDPFRDGVPLNATLQ